MDTNRTLEIKGSPGPVACVAAAFMAVSALCLFASLMPAGLPALRGTSPLALWTAAAACAALAVLLARAAMDHSGVVITISPEGFGVTGPGGEVVPWWAVTGVEVLRVGSSRFMRLHLSDGYDRPRKGWVASFSGHRIDLASTFLRVGFDEMVRATVAYKKVAIDEMPMSMRHRVHALPDDRMRTKAVAMPGTGRPWATFALLAIMGLVFFLEVFLGRNPVDVPMPTLVEMGGLSRDLFDGGAWWRFLTAPMLHGGAFHLAMNGLALWVGGMVLERVLGWRWYLVAFALSALAGCAGSYLFNDPRVVTVGASGGILGLFACGVVVALRHPSPEVKATLLMAALRVLVPTLMSFGGTRNLHVDVAAHLGGVAGGVLAGILVVALCDFRTSYPRHVAIATVLCLAYAIALGTSAALAGLSATGRLAASAHVPGTEAATGVSEDELACVSREVRSAMRSIEAMKPGTQVRSNSCGGNVVAETLDGLRVIHVDDVEDSTCRTFVANTRGFDPVYGAVANEVLVKDRGVVADGGEDACHAGKNGLRLYFK